MQKDEFGHFTSVRSQADKQTIEIKLKINNLTSKFILLFFLLLLESLQF